MRCLVELSRWKNNFFEVVCCEMKTIKVYNFKLHQLQFQSSIVWIGLTGSWYLPPLGGRKFFFQQNLCHWGRGPGWPVVRDSFLPNPDGKNVILETSRQNLLKFCIRLPITILRTNPYWHFAQKTQKVGQNLSFLVKKWRFFENFFFRDNYS